VTVYVSALELFSIGIGPSSSHTVGPMRAARRFVSALEDRGLLADVTHVTCVLCGSLAATGVGHGTPDAVVAGLAGLEPETCDPDEVHGAWASATGHGTLTLAEGPTVSFDTSDITFEPRTRMPEHPNALILRAYTCDRSAHDRGAAPAFEQTWFSIGGGFVQLKDVPGTTADGPRADDWAYSNAAELLALCAREGIDMCDVAWRAELGARSEADVRTGLDAIWLAMHGSVERGLVTGIHELPGGLHVPRRAAAMRERLEAAPADLPDLAGEWMRAFALAVNEENAAGGRVVTAPTNGAAGILPAVLEYHMRFNPRATDADVQRFLLTAAAVGGILKANASISGAEGGCQAEVGSACAMAAAGLCAVLGGTPAQVENAAEIAVEHHLGLTCDPVGGLVQIPCIERNAIASSTAVSAARLALSGDGRHIVPLDVAIETMRQTGADMSDRYKETSAAGLAVNVVEC
jgi:L-serine dehydratase